MHLVEYGLLGAALARGWLRRRAGAAAVGEAKVIGFAALLCLAYGMSDEFHQTFVPGRHADLADIVADVVGGTTGAVAVLWRTRRERAKRIS